MKLILILFFISGLISMSQAQTAHRIIYSSYEYDHGQSLGEKGDVYSYIIFNDSVAYKFFSKDTDTNSVYNQNFVSHSELYVKSNEQLYYQYGNKKKYKWRISPQLNIDWRTMPDSTKSILGYHCTKAWGMNKGSMIYIWFTTELPGHYGPLSASRYPGVALEVYLLQSGKAILTTNIEKGNYEIVIPKNLPQQKNTP